MSEDPRVGVGERRERERERERERRGEERRSTECTEVTRAVVT